MEGVEGLYKKFGVLADAKDKAGEYEAEYISILSTISNGSDAEKRLCASFIPRFFKSFPDHQEAAFNAQIDLCEEEEAVIRREAIKGLPDLCKADSKLVPRMANVLAQLLPIEGHLDQTIVKHCLVQLIKQDVKSAVAGIVNQVITGDEIVREKSLKFLCEKLEKDGTFVTNLSTNAKDFIVDQFDRICESVTYNEYIAVTQLAANVDGKRTAQMIAKHIDMEKPFDPSNTEEIERFILHIPVYLKHLPRTSATSCVLKYFTGVLPVFSQISGEEHKLMLLQCLAETLRVSVTEADSAMCLDGLYSLLLTYLPGTVPTTDEVDDPPSINISMLECLLYAIHKTAQQVPEYLKEENKIKDISEKLQFALRCCTCFAKRLKSSSISDDTPEKVKLKTKAFKTCNNAKELIKGLVSSPISYKTDINLSWRVDLSNVTNKLVSPHTEKRPLTVLTASKPPTSPTPKRRRSGTSTQQVYAPPQGRYSGVGQSNGQPRSRSTREKSREREREQRRGRRF